MMILSRGASTVPSRAFIASLSQHPGNRYVHAATHTDQLRRDLRRLTFQGSNTRQLLQSRSSRIVPPLRAVVVSQADSAHVQLATAKLPQGTRVEDFKSSLYQWANTLTSSGQNLPFALPLRTNLTADGFQISLLRIHQGEPVSVGNIDASVEEVPDAGKVLFLRFTEGEGAQLVRNSPLPQDPKQRLQTILQGLVDVPLIMNTMKGAIKSAAAQARE